MKFIQNNWKAIAISMIAILAVSVILMYATETVETEEGAQVQRFKFLNK